MRKIAGLIILLLLPSVAMATITDISQMMINLRTVLVPAMKMLLMVSWICGIILIIRGIMTLKAMGQPLTQQSRPGELSGPMVYIFVGAVLMYIPSSTNVLTNSLFGTGTASIFGNGINFAATGQASNTIMDYTNISIESQWATLIDTIFYYIEFIGFIAFIRGWMIISAAGQPGAQPGSIAKGLTHVIGGILAINFLPLVNAVHNTVMRSH